uniref:Uncharacterized protein n=1 Tax=Arundo donax TaxID=35708 RepID=A0A0A9G3F4_ARUDO
MGTTLLNAKTLVSSIGIVKVIHILFSVEFHTHLRCISFQRFFYLARFILPTILAKFVVILMWNKLGCKQKP